VHPFQRDTRFGSKHFVMRDIVRSIKFLLQRPLTDVWRAQLSTSTVAGRPHALPAAPPNDLGHTLCSKVARRPVGP
jgi:hypothetical protein